MKQSELFSQTIKEVPRDADSVNARLLQQAGFIYPEMAGVYTYLPLGLRVLRKVEQVIREEMDAIGGQELLMPALQPKEYWEQTGRWDKIDVMFKVKSRSTKEYALGPTHEEIIAELARHYIRSYKDLPKYVYQIQNKFRDEARAKSGLLRGREFGMKDLYSFNTSRAQMQEFYELSKKAYLKIFARLGLTAYINEASGGDFTKEFSHEFTVLTKAGEDTIVYCESCDFAQNTEITDVKPGEQCPKCKKAVVKESKAVEVGNIFDLGTKFTEAFEAFYTDEKGKQQLIYMGCYGIGTGRLMGTIVEACHDERGIIWPESAAPYDVHLISLGDQGEPAYKSAEDIYNKLKTGGVDVLWDDRDMRPGQKFADSDLIGIPWRIVVSPKTLEQKKVEIKKRGTEEIQLISQRKLLSFLK